VGSNAASSSLDWSRLSPGTRIAAVGALLLVPAVFMPWVQVSIGATSEGVRGWDAFRLAQLAFVAARVALLVLVLEQTRPDVTLPAPASVILTACGAIALAGGAWHLLFLPGTDAAGRGLPVEVGRAYGVFVAAAAAAALTYGGWRRRREP
jgi:hypothetical protein